MATSGTTTWQLNRNEIITAALRKLRVINAAATAPAADITTGTEALNAMVKSWQIKPSGAINLWFDTEVCLFLEKGASSYTLGPSGGHCCRLSDAVVMKLTAAAVAGATVLAVDDNTGLTASDYLGVELDDGTIQWSTQNGAPAGTTGARMTAALTSAAAVGNYVFGYTTKIDRVKDILEARVRDVNDSDTPLNIVESRRQFMAITDKTSTGVVSDIYLSPAITNSVLYVWPTADDVQQRVIMTVRRICEDFTGSANNFDGPPEALRALIFNLAVEIAPEYGVAVPQLVMALAASSLADLESFYRTREPVQLFPGR